MRLVGGLRRLPGCFGEVELNCDGDPHVEDEEMEKDRSSFPSSDRPRRRSTMGLRWPMEILTRTAALSGRWSTRIGRCRRAFVNAAEGEKRKS